MEEKSKKQKNKDLLTIIILPETGGGVRRIKLHPAHRAWLKRGAMLFVFCAIAITGFAIVSLQHTAEFLNLREQVALQKTYILQADRRLADLQSSLERIQIFEQKVRIVLGQSPSSPGEEFVGIGGPNKDDLDPLLVPEDRALVKRLDIGLERTELETDMIEPSIQQLHSLIQDQANLLQSTPSVWPTRGWVTSRFGERISPFTGLRTPHEGLDIATRMGSPVQAPSDGIVLFAGILGGYGKSIVIDHGYDVTTRFAHLAEVGVSQGQKVKRGDLIGKVGSTGRSTGPHLHYEVRLRSIPVDPQRYLLLH